MSKNLFYHSDEMSSPPSKFVKPTSVTRKHAVSKPHSHPHSRKSNKEWDLVPIVSSIFEKEFQNDQSGIKINDYKWSPIKESLIDISLQPWVINLPTVLERTLFQDYKQDLQSFNLLAPTIEKVKVKLFNGIIAQIKRQLKHCNFPSDNHEVITNDMDPEFIFAKRKYIQSLVNDEYHHVKQLETDLHNESQNLTRARATVKDLQRSNHRVLKDLVRDKSLHPLVNKIIQREYGIIKDENSSYTGPWRKNNAKYNLMSDQHRSSSTPGNSDDEYEILTDSLPSLKRVNDFMPSMTDTISQLLQSQPDKQLKDLFHK